MTKSSELEEKSISEEGLSVGVNGAPKSQGFISQRRGNSLSRYLMLHRRRQIMYSLKR